MFEEFKDLAMVALAAILAGVVGIEREAGGKPAGFRTHMIVGGASALLVITAKWLLEGFPVEVPKGELRFDPLRVIEAIIVGVSFLGAGTILKMPSGVRVHYLTSAASLLFSAGIGISVAVERLVLAFGVMGIALLINVGFKRLERRLLPGVRESYKGP